MNPEQSEWLQGLIKAAGLAVERTPKSSSARYRSLGSLHAVPERGAGWYRCNAPKNVNLESLDDAVLAPASGPNVRKHQVLDSSLELPWLYLRAGSTTPERGMSLWVPSFDARQLAEALRDSLKEIPAGSLAERFATRTLDAIPASSSNRAGLQGTQAEAFRACCAKGLQLVWGPPGTGKTHVIVESIDAMLAQGKSVLLVSSTNVAVDNAVENIASKTNPKPGRVVRVGTPVVPAVAKDRRVALPLLVEARQAALTAEIADLNERINRLERDERLRSLAKAERELQGFDLDAYDTAMTLTSNRRVADLANDTLAKCEDRTAVLRNRVQGRARTVVKSKWILCRAKEFAAEARVTEIKTDLEYLESLSAWAKLRKKARIATLGHQLHQAHERRVDAGVERRDLEEWFRAKDIDPRELADEAECRIEPFDAEQRLRQAESALQEAREEAGLAELRQRDAAGRLTSAMTEPMPTREHTGLIAEAERRGIPALRDRLPAMRKDAATVLGEIDKARKRLESAEDKLQKMRRSAEAAVISQASVVACTLAAMAKRKPIRERRFDYVIVDEAAACKLPDLVNAVGRAEIGAVLVGDYLQNGPIVEPHLRQEPALKRYFESDCFTHFTVTDPATARARAGCAVLNEQRRFGPAVTDLINRVVYDSILVQRQAQGGEIVLIDVDGLGGDLTDIQRTGKYKGQWPIGALLARAIAEMHTNRNETVGVVTPFKEQAEATKSLLSDSAFGPAIEVGTAHAFQGREFDVVLFDMVEDGRGQIANADRGSDFALSGLRIFNVALTRARSRTYLVAQGPAVLRARRGPLAAIRLGLENGSIRHVRATEVLGIDEPTGGSEAFTDVREALKDYVRVCGIYDQATTFEPLIHRIDQARDSVWLWSPWIGKANLTIQDSLVEAVERGVSVTVLTRPDRELNAAQQSSSLAFRERFGGRVLFQLKMHQKIAVVDRRWTFTGSMNLLSARELASQRTKEFMLEIEDGSYATLVLDQQKEPDLRASTPCPTCENGMRHVDIRGRGKDRVWTWMCDLDADGCKGRLKFSNDAKPHGK